VTSRGKERKASAHAVQGATMNPKVTTNTPALVVPSERFHAFSLRSLVSEAWLSSAFSNIGQNAFVQVRRDAETVIH
jgi:hypothetical protein